MGINVTIIGIIILSFILGFIAGFLFKKYVALEVKCNFKKSDTKEKIEKPKNIRDIQILLDYVKKNDNLPIEVSPIVFRSLKEIAKTKDWDTKLDETTVKNLHKLALRYINYKKRPINQQEILRKQEIIRVNKDNCFNFEEPKYWQGTMEEYKEALKKGLIDIHTKVIIVENGEGYWLALDEYGQMEEYMD